jgi:threonine dehydrogenase-like Zn-dependent dehydrogenase
MNAVPMRFPVLLWRRSRDGFLRINYFDISGRNKTMNFPVQPKLPVAVIGAGPVGLAAAAHLAERGVPFVVFEAGEGPAAAVRQWGHVTFFSPWRFNVDSAAERLLKQTAWTMPDPDRDPTGQELIDDYLAPLAALPVIAPSIRYGARLTAVTRQGMDRVPSKGREQRPFEISLTHADGKMERVLASAVIDASGTWSAPNPAGANGIPALGEKESVSRICTGIPDVFGVDRKRYAGKRVVAIGSGHSAMDSILNLVRLKAQVPATEIIWAMRSAPLEKTFGGGAADQLSNRGALGERAKATIASGNVSVEAPFRVHGFALRKNAIEIADEAGKKLVADEVIVATGFRPDFSMLSEIRLDLHPWLECTRELGPLIDPNEHSCGDVPPHGVKELTQPENNFFIVGMKSYGRAPTFLMATGYEQVRSVVAALAGDMEAALDTKLVLPQTGVCEGLGHADEGGCCGGPSLTRADACCNLEAIEKDAGKSGCGCLASGTC